MLKEHILINGSAMDFKVLLLWQIWSHVIAQSHCYKSEFVFMMVVRLQLILVHIVLIHSHARHLLAIEFRALQADSFLAGLIIF
jgi:hypothetical protein